MEAETAVMWPQPQLLEAPNRWKSQEGSSQVPPEGAQGNAALPTPSSGLWPLPTMVLLQQPGTEDLWGLLQAACAFSTDLNSGQ